MGAGNGRPYVPAFLLHRAQPTSRDGRPPRPNRHPSRLDRDPRVPARGHHGNRQGDDAARPGGPGRPGDALQHLPPVPAPWGGRGGGVRRPAQLHELEAAGHDRLGRLPGLLAGLGPRTWGGQDRRLPRSWEPPGGPTRGVGRGGPGPHRRRRGQLPLAPGRLEASPESRDLDSNPGAVGGGHDPGLRRVHLADGDL